PGALSYTTPASIVAADFDGDGNADLMAATQALGLTPFRGSGDGNFTAVAQKTGYNLNSYPIFLATGDFNKDTKIDLAVLNQDGTVSILLNACDGSFPTQKRYVAGTQMSAGVFAGGVFVTDFNDDGNLDLGFGNGHPDALYPIPTSVSVLYVKGDGSFYGTPVFPTGNYPGSMVSGDFNGDGVLDLVAGANL